MRAFIELVNPLENQLFVSEADLVVSRAPGRLDVMGGIVDYSGSHVLEFPLAEATFAAIQLNAERTLRIVSLLEDGPLSFTMSLGVFDGPIEYEAARKFFQHDAANRWAAYVAGVFLVLMRECDVNFASGANILISSRVPPGKGVSSSAALEVAVMQAVTEVFNIALEPRDVALLCQKVENLVVGAPCGVMDQMTAVFAERDRLLLLLCQPAEVKQMIALPRQLRLWGIDSGVRHSVSGNSYREVRAATFSGSKIITETRLTNYLANISPAEFERDVDLVRKEGPRAGLYGAKITGGGSGGTVAVLGDQTSQPAIDRVVAAYANETGHKPHVFSDSSSGSLAFGHLRLRES